MRNILLACFLSSCLWAVPCMAKGDANVGLYSVGDPGFSGTVCGDTTFASRFSGDSVRCFTAMGPLTFVLPAHTVGKQDPIPFLIGHMPKDQERFTQHLKPFKEGSTSVSLFAVPLAVIIGAMLLTWVTLHDWEAPFEDDKENLI